MLYKSLNFNGEECSFYKRKRKDTRVPFSLDIFYPNINNNIDNVNFSVDKPVLRAINISEGGMCFISSVKIECGDFISFLLKVGDNPSFACLVNVKWVGFLDDAYFFGCQFIKLEWHQLKQIKSYIGNYVEKHRR